MGYAAYLRGLLQPLGVYDLSETSYSGAEIAAQGGAMDAFSARAELLLRESVIATAEDAGLSLYEKLLPLHPPTETTEDRRAAILGLTKQHGHSLREIERTLADCGVNVALSEDPEDSSNLIAVFVGAAYFPVNFAAVDKIVRQIIPVHLGVEYRVDPEA